jgi:hypothetical protein
MESGRNPRHHDNGECAFDLRQRLRDAIDKRVRLGVRNELDDNFRIGRGLEIRAFALQSSAHRAQVHQVAVVRDGDEAFGRLHANGLRVQQRRVAGGGVARVPDRHGAGQLGQHIVGENLADQAHAFDVGQPLPIG